MCEIEKNGKSKKKKKFLKKKLDLSNKSKAFEKIFQSDTCWLKMKSKKKFISLNFAF